MNLCKAIIQQRTRDGVQYQTYLGNREEALTIILYAHFCLQ